MDSMIKKKDPGFKDHSMDESGDDLPAYEFIIQTMNDNSQTWENCFDIKCVANEEKRQE